MLFRLVCCAFLLELVITYAGTADAAVVMLEPGSRGSAVTELQAILASDASIYPEGYITGFYGPMTVAAIQRFQCKYGIVCEGDPATTGYGRVGPRTLTKVREMSRIPDVVATSATRDDNIPGKIRFEQLGPRDASLMPFTIQTGLPSESTRELVFVTPQNYADILTLLQRESPPSSIAPSGDSWDFHMTAKTIQTGVPDIYYVIDATQLKAIAIKIQLMFLDQHQVVPQWLVALGRI